NLEVPKLTSHPLDNRKSPRPTLRKDRNNGFENVMDDEVFRIQTQAETIRKYTMEE
ncbi:hypothetical protein JTB14_001411, partial [Gonioctena quinquepunctata]